MNVDGNVVDCGCNGVVLSDGVIGEKGFEGDANKGDAVMNGGDKSTNTRITRTVLTDSGLVWEGVC